MNEELTAEEWKRRYEKEKDRVARLKGELARAEAELERWRKGEQVSPDEQIKIEAIDSDLSASGPAPASATPGTSNVSATAGALSDATYVVASISKEDWEREKSALYAQLEEKDDEISNSSQAVEKLKLQLLDQEDLINQLRKENDDLQNKINSLEIENESQKDEVKEVLKALEELAMNFDQKQQEADMKTKENETLTQELEKKGAHLKNTQDEMETVKDTIQTQRKRNFEIMVTLIKDLGDIGNILGGQIATEFKVVFVGFYLELYV